MLRWQLTTIVHNSANARRQETVMPTAQAANQMVNGSGRAVVAAYAPEGLAPPWHASTGASAAALHDGWSDSQRGVVVLNSVNAGGPDVRNATPAQGARSRRAEETCGRRVT